jgi:vacuolar-type H+-ATPase subunit I/STV1
MGNYHDRGNTSDDAKSSGLSELQKQVDKLKRDAKARKEADEGARMQVLKVAEEAASHRALLQRKESEVEDLKKAIKEVKDKAHRELEEIREREKISIREAAMLQAKLDEQTRLQIENAEKRLAERSEDLERHHEALEKLEQSNNKKLQECVSKIVIWLIYWGQDFAYLALYFNACSSCQSESLAYLCDAYGIIADLITI